VKAGADYLTSTSRPAPSRAGPLADPGGGRQVRVALNPGHAPEVLEYVLDDLDLVLVMSVNPASAGKSFIRPPTRRSAGCGPSWAPATSWYPWTAA